MDGQDTGHLLFFKKKKKKKEKKECILYILYTR